MFHRSHSIWFVGLPFAIACTTEQGASGPETSGPGISEPKVSETQHSLTLAERIAACNADPRVITGLVSVDVCVGADLFFRETFGGNGRSCATCHPVDHNLTIDPPFISKVPQTDPLFVAENNLALASLEVPTQMRGRGVILENVDGFSNPTQRFVLRSVPHTLSLAVSVATPPEGVVPPADRTGWSGDGAPGTGALRDFMTGAITQHYPKTLNRVAGVDFRLAVAGELDRIDLYMRQTGRLNDLNLATVRMSDAGAEAGRQTFLAVGCNNCHGNAGANATFAPGNRNFNTGIEASRDFSLTGFPRDGGFGQVSDNLGGFGDGTFNTPPLVEAADTAPFFHTDIKIVGASAHNTTTARTIEDAIAFYDSPAFNNSPSGKVGPINIDATQIDNIGRFLRVINAQFNIQQALKRFNAASTLLQRFGDTHKAIQRRLIDLGLTEVFDAINVLSGVPGLNQPAIDALQRSLPHAGLAQSGPRTIDRDSGLAGVLEELDVAAFELGTNLNFTIGAGTLMF